MKLTIKQFYNKNACDYDQHMKKTGHYTAQNKIIKRLNNFITDPILDVACGTGHLVSQLSKKYKFIIGNDYSKEMCKITLHNFPKIRIICKNAETLNGNYKYNTLICCNFFYYIQNYSTTLQNWKRLLTNTGKLIIIEEYPFITHNINHNQKLSKKLKRIIAPKTPKEINTILNENNFKLIKVTKTKIDNKHKLFGFVFGKQ